MKLPSSSSLPTTLNLLTTTISAVSESASFSSFPTLHSSITSSLSELSDILSRIPENSSPLLPQFLSDLSLTLSQILNITQSPLSGKLRIRNDLSATSNSLLRLSENSQLLLHSPTSLRTQLQLGNDTTRLETLHNFLTNLHNNPSIDEDPVPAILRLLDSSTTLQVREKASASIAKLSTIDSYNRQLAANPDALPRLARLLESSSGPAKEHSCIALQTLTLTRDAAVSIGSLGCIAALVDICSMGTPSAQAAAAGVLRNLARFRELKQKFLDEDVLPVLIGVLSSGTVLAQENVVGCFRNLSEGEESENLKLAIFQVGGLDCIRSYLEGGVGVENQNVENVVCLLRNLGSFRYIAESIANAGFIPWIVAALDSKLCEARVEAAKAVGEFASVMGRSRRELGEALPFLVMMLEAKAVAENEAAVVALGSLLSLEIFRKVFKKEERGIANVVQLLDPLVSDVEKKHVISVLVLLLNSRKSRKRMVEAGACKFLQRLVAMEVDGAKRVLEVLDKGKIWGVFSWT